MNTWAIIPAKCFDRAKSRLEPALTESQRHHLAREMFHIVMRTVKQCDSISGTLVIADCPEASEAAHRHNAILMADSPGGLAASIDEAIASLQRHAEAVLVLMGDLPHIQVGEITELVSRLELFPAVVAPDRQREGTNALALRTPPPIKTAFGRVGSFDEHMRRLNESGCTPDIFVSDGLAFDVDSPDDVPLISPNRFRKPAR